MALEKKKPWKRPSVRTSDIDCTKTLLLCPTALPVNCELDFPGCGCLPKGTDCTSTCGGP